MNLFIPSTLSFLAFVAVFLILPSLHMSSANIVENDEHWDILVFTQHWPVTVCYSWKEEKPTHSCSLPSQRDTWTVHGIWPTKLGTIGPGYCNKTWLFNVTEVEPILTQLEQFWINIEKDTPVSDLWKHEWIKHGTCAASVQALNGEINYFAQGLRWLQLYTMSDILGRANIIPDKDAEFMPSDIYTAVRNHIGKNPMIVCQYDKRTGNEFLFEIRICFTKDLQLTDCDNVRLSGLTQEAKERNMNTNCDLSKSVVYTNVVPIEGLVEPTSTLINVYKFLTWLRWFTL